MFPVIRQIAGSKRIGWAVVLLLVVFGVIADIEHTLLHGGIDFRNRLIGARLMLADEDPYWYKWKPGDPLCWLDPTDPPEKSMNRNTVAPTCLALYAPLAPLGYMQARVVWLLAGWAAYVGLAALLVTAAPPGQDRRLIFILMLLAFLGDTWRAHVALGQVYILYALLLGVCYRITRSGSQVLGGLVLGLLVSLRPTMLVVVVPFALSRRWWFVAATFGGAAAGVLGSLIVADSDDWASYFRAMDATCEAFMRSEELTLPYWKPHPTAPPIIEGCDHLARHATFNQPDSGFGRAVQYFSVPHGKLVAQSAMLAYIGLATVCVFRCWRPPVSLGTTFFIGAVIAISAEFFLPIHRGGYANIVWLIPAAVLIAEGGASWVFSSRLVWLLLVGLLLTLGLVPVARADTYAISDLCVLVYFGIVAVQLARGAQRSAP